MAEPAWSQAIQATRLCNVMLSVGTSGMVYPAATLPVEARSAGARVIDIGPEPGSGDVWLEGRAGDVLSVLVREAFPNA